MKRVVAINGSPKSAESTSGMLIKILEEYIGTIVDTFQAVELIRREDAHKVIADILKADDLLIVFPLYVDSLPASLLKLLTQIEQAAKACGSSLPTVYTICNCGFYEAEHNSLALKMTRTFVKRIGAGYGYGLGIGCGGVLAQMKKGPVDNVYAALRDMGDAITAENSKECEDVFVTPKMPRFLYKIGGNIGWRQMTRKNGVLKQIKAKPHSL
ncbi:NAD(P)H-dependent oxidoreductase [Lutispora saccharofermentans]|uniref:NAD(P)H-dependent oxidoreductase n=1 Tax=Lutispora saccharofermentans TaxID=3024236 RepID=A0ABT1NHT7_9FIRM|nr:NAD(P)H-dependent oxidoreductase [Lutispora saccharofermentans]MCQ1530832.1 NAD(P)H-dependent oxidoreductase [Lutispora saccharofermentans]